MAGQRLAEAEGGGRKGGTGGEGGRKRRDNTEEGGKGGTGREGGGGRRKRRDNTEEATGRALMGGCEELYPECRNDEVLVEFLTAMDDGL